MQQAERQPPPDAPRMGETGLGDGTGPGAGWRTAFREATSWRWVALVVCSAATCGPLFLLLFIVLPGLATRGLGTNTLGEFLLGFLGVNAFFIAVALYYSVWGVICGFFAWLPTYAGLRRRFSRRKAAIRAAAPSVFVAAVAAQLAMLAFNSEQWSDVISRAAKNLDFALPVAAAAAANGALHASWIWRNRA
ncbi:hypothetical protein [Stappia indica]|nr:hypothetical protein [Stappia indica]